MRPPAEAEGEAGVGEIEGTSIMGRASVFIARTANGGGSLLVTKKRGEINARAQRRKGATIFVCE
jgi:hypothetical protein